MQEFLNVTKSLIISSPAGSGKTEKLARRYIGLLKAGSDVERILAITFTEKASAEMKQRILDILQRDDQLFFESIKDKIPLMRISTIHSFCLRLLKRFSIELGLDPSLGVLDEFNAYTLWHQAGFECLETEKNKPSLFFDAMKEHGLRGNESLGRVLDELYRMRPRPELILKEGYNISTEDEKRILALYAKCLERYEMKKRERHALDFSDLEIFTYEALSGSAEWHNILYAFDEHTDHLLVDEFQDTSTLQWRIIDKLTEEWRSGMGAKKDMGKTPTIFLVGDEKQSIYHFRGANVSVFEAAKQKFSEWLGKDYSFEEIKDNYRSLPEIVNFVNSLFERLMTPQLEKWRTRYCPFNAIRNGKGAVELILFEDGINTKQNRMKEAGILAKAIKGLHGRYEVFSGNTKRPSKFQDMVILLRRRTHLSIFENALRKEGIPFIVQKGIGFFDEPETALLREFVLFIIDSSDDYSLFNLLRSPFFGIDLKSLFNVISSEEGILREKLHEHKDFKKVSELIESWIQRSAFLPISMLIEDMLIETSGWSYFQERQRYANIKKFISMVEAFEAGGLCPLEIREKLIRQRHVSEVPKANVNAEEMDAVKIMTVHAAKGLQFPMVFVPSLDEPNMPRTSMIAIDDEPEGITFSYEPETEKRKRKLLFEKQKQKELEEEKRLFYVSLTRAMDYLCMSGALKDNKGKEAPSRLAYIKSAFGQLEPPLNTFPFDILTESDVMKRYESVSGISMEEDTGFMSEASYTSAVPFEPAFQWRTVTEDIDIRAKHGDDWVVTGRILHTLFEEISKGIISPKDIKERAGLLLREEAMEKPAEERVMEIIITDIEKLNKKGLLESIILPKGNSFSEQAFHIQIGRSVFKGRIDRLIFPSEKEALIYDYKTFPVRDKEMPELIEEYRFQMEVYKEAVERIFKVKVKAYLLFTHLPEIIQIC